MKQVRVLRVVVAALVTTSIVLIGGGQPAGASSHRTTTDVFAIDGSGVRGQATLVRSANGLSVSTKNTTGGELFVLPAGTPLGVEWEPGDATTMWFVVFNAPQNCSDFCGEDDVIAAFNGDNDAGVGIHYATGHVAGKQWGAGASLKEWDTSGAVFGMALEDSTKAEVHVVFRSHGPAENLTPGELDDALHTLNGGCAINTCGDAQAAVFIP